jgi:hypothetical protein
MNSPAETSTLLGKLVIRLYLSYESKNLTNGSKKRKFTLLPLSSVSVTFLVLPSNTFSPETKQ